MPIDYWKIGILLKKPKKTTIKNFTEFELECMKNWLLLSSSKQKDFEKLAVIEREKYSKFNQSQPPPNLQVSSEELFSLLLY